MPFIGIKYKLFKEEAISILEYLRNISCLLENKCVRYWQQKPMNIFRIAIICLLPACSVIKFSIFGCHLEKVYQIAVLGTSRKDVTLG